LGLIILEDPANEAYKSDMSPKYNTADLAQKISEIYSCPLELISQIPSIPHYQSAKEGTLEIKNRIDSSRAKINLINTTEEIKSGNFSIFSRDLKKQIIESAEKGEKILIFSSRKGYSNLMCANCGSVSKCPNCSVPLRLYGRKESELICHRCSLIQKIPDYCLKCNSHKLKSSGFPGSQKIEEEIDFILEQKKKRLPVFILDSSLIKKAKEEQEIIKKIESGPCICIATQMIFSHRYSLSFNLIGIPNADALATIPNYSSEEDIFYQFEKLLDFEPGKIFIQTHNPESALYSSISVMDYKSFYDQEIPVRKLFSFPPFARLVKISYRNANAGKAGYEAKILSEKLKMALAQKNLSKSVKILGPSKGFIEKERGLFVYNIVLKISPDQKPEEILRFVPSNWNIDVDPKSIL
jgi:primosomal protein N' (replication factor Y) (superfamily II helicase)